MHVDLVKHSLDIRMGFCLKKDIDHIFFKLTVNDRPVCLSTTFLIINLKCFLRLNYPLKLVLCLLISLLAFRETLKARSEIGPSAVGKSSRSCAERQMREALSKRAPSARGVVGTQIHNFGSVFVELARQKLDIEKL